MNWSDTLIKMSSDTDHFQLFAWTFINEISVILDKHKSKRYNLHINDEKDKTFIQWHSSSYVCSIIPTHSIATSTEIDQFNVWSTVFHHVYKTVGFEWYFGKRFTLASPYAPLVGFTVRTWSRTQFKSRWGKKHRNGRVLYLKLTRQLSLFLKIFRVVLFKLTRRLLQWKKRDNCVLDKS